MTRWSPGWQIRRRAAAPRTSRLSDRAGELSRRFTGRSGAANERAWSGRQGQRWGSCSVADGSIRTARGCGDAELGVDYVLLHELAHLLSAGHGPEFWALLGGYAHTERARGFLDGFAFASDVAPAMADSDAIAGPGDRAGERADTTGERADTSGDDVLVDPAGAGTSQSV